MRLRGACSTALVPALLLGACAWAPFDESLLDGPDAAPSARGPADDPRETTRRAEPSDEGADAGVTPEPDASAEDVADVRARRGMQRTSGEVEPDDSMATAQTVGLFYTVLAEWTPAGDDDWYAVDLLAGDRLDVRTRADDGGCDFDSIVLVYPEGVRPSRSVSNCSQADPSALVCVDDAGDSPCASTTFVAPETGRYYVRAVEYGDDEHALYTIDFELVP